jgi:small subunit ribosomal protein S7
MARGKKTFPKRPIQPDPKFNSVVLEKFANHLMQGGGKETARRALYKALAESEAVIKKPPMEVFAKALRNIAPQVEIKSRRIGGANYQVPVPVQGERKRFLAMTWLISVARAKKGSPISKRLSQELIAAYNNEGETIKKKINVERMAEANRAFAFLGRRR